MNNNKEILSELQGISPLLASISGKPVFALPEGYFDGLSEKIFLKIEGEVDAHFSKNRVQAVPEGYFEHLSGQILSKINSGAAAPTETEDEVSPVLASLRDKSSYRVPEGYFDQLSGKLMERMHSKPARVVPINRWWQYAVAAMVAGLVLLAAWPWLDGNTNRAPSVVVEQTHDLPLDLASQFNTPEKIHEGIEALSDDAIAGYLAEHGSILDNEFLIKGMEVQGMPEAIDYILQEDALGNYLDELQHPG